VANFFTTLAKLAKLIKFRKTKFPNSFVEKEKNVEEDIIYNSKKPFI
jgi:hypothetical protein